MMGVFVQVNEGSSRAKTQLVGYILQENGCWDWVGATRSNGYGQWTPLGTTKAVAAHRFIYETHRGPVPKGLELDHLCRNRLCVNPDHLEAVTHKVNCLRGKSPHILVHVSGKCAKGHTDWRKRPKGYLACWTCHNERRRADYARNRDARRAELRKRYWANPERSRKLARESQRERRRRKTITVEHPDEDVAYANARAFRNAVGEKRGVRVYLQTQEVG